jgi:hypothetical protein
MKKKIIFRILSILISILILFLVDRALSLVLKEDFLNPVPLIRGLEFQNTLEAGGLVQDGVKAARQH